MQELGFSSDVPIEIVIGGTQVYEIDGAGKTLNGLLRKEPAITIRMLLLSSAKLHLLYLLMLELITYYVIGGALLVGAPAIFFLIVFMPALQNTKGRMVGYKDHKTYGDISSYENAPSRSTTFIWSYHNDNRNINRTSERIL